MSYTRQHILNHYFNVAYLVLFVVSYLFSTWYYAYIIFSFQFLMNHYHKHSRKATNTKTLHNNFVRWRHPDKNTRLMPIRARTFFKRIININLMYRMIKNTFPEDRHLVTHTRCIFRQRTKLRKKFSRYIHATTTYEHETEYLATTEPPPPEWKHRLRLPPTFLQCTLLRYSHKQRYILRIYGYQITRST